MKYRKFLACILCATCVCTAITGCGTVADESNVIYEDETEELMQVVTGVINSGSSDAQKEETVYVKTNASGEVNSVVVSNWLKNVESTSKLDDYTQLENITNVKGKEEFTEEDGKIVWDSEGKDIYYQGTTNKQLPVDVNINYELDGKEMAAEDMKGKDGHVKITIEYTNNSSNQVIIGDSEETIYTPFAVVSGMMLDTGKYTNVEVSNGTVISDGKRDVVVGMAFPGLIDSLNGKKVEDEDLLSKIEEQLSIPTNVVIEADVTDFESTMILTMVNSDIVNSLGLDALDTGVDLDEINSKIDEFSDAGRQLEDGTKTLKNGAKDLLDGTYTFVDGTGKLKDGVVKYTDGVSKVADGAVSLNDGAAKLDGGATELQSGINAVDSGVGELKTGIDAVEKGANTLNDGAKQVDDGAKEVSVGAGKVSAGVDALIVNMQNIASGVGTASQAAAQISGGIDQIVAAVSVETSPDQIDTSTISVSGCISGEQASAVFVNNISDETLASFGLSDEQIGNVKAMMGQIAAGVIPSVADTAATTAARQAAAVAGANGANQAKGAIKDAIVNNGLQAGAKQLSDSLSASYNTLTSAETQAQLAELKNGASAVANGASQVAGGTSALKAGAQQLHDGTRQLVEGSAKLKNGTEALSTGAKNLKDGTSQLKNGTSQLVSGTNELRSNSSTLINGASDLANGSTTLSDGVKQLYDGTVKLNDGMVEFNEEGISKLTSVFNSDFDLINGRIKAISDAGKAYTSFAGALDTEKSNVKFIIESE